MRSRWRARGRASHRRTHARRRPTVPAHVPGDLEAGVARSGGRPVQDLARAVQQCRPAASAGSTHARLRRMVEVFEGPQTARGQEGLAYVVRGGAKQLYVETDDNTLYFKSSQSTEKEWVLIEVTPSATPDPRAPEHAGYDRVVPEKQRRIPPLKPRDVQPEVKPVAPPSQVALELMQYTNHFYIRNLAGEVDELLGDRKST